MLTHIFQGSGEAEYLKQLWLDEWELNSQRVTFESWIADDKNDVKELTASTTFRELFEDDDGCKNTLVVVVVVV